MSPTQRSFQDQLLEFLQMWDIITINADQKTYCWPSMVGCQLDQQIVDYLIHDIANDWWGEGIRGIRDFETYDRMMLVEVIVMTRKLVDVHLRPLFGLQ